MEWASLNYFERGPPKDPVKFCEIPLERFMRCYLKYILFTDGHAMITKVYIEPTAQAR